MKTTRWQYTRRLGWHTKDPDGYLWQKDGALYIVTDEDGRQGIGHTRRLALIALYEAA